MNTGKLDRQDLEIKRQLIHLLNGCATALAVYFLLPIFGLWILLILAVALLFCHLSPVLLPHSPLVKTLMHHFERKKDIKEFPFKGAVFFGYGLIPPIVLLEPAYATAVILVLSVGDSMSTLFGKRYGRIKVGEKSIEGFIAFVFFSFIATVWFVGFWDALMLANNWLMLTNCIQAAFSLRSLQYSSQSPLSHRVRSALSLSAPMRVQCMLCFFF